MNHRDQALMRRRVIEGPQGLYVVDPELGIGRSRRSAEHDEHRRSRLVLGTLFVLLPATLSPQVDAFLLHLAR